MAEKEEGIEETDPLQEMIDKYKVQIKDLKSKAKSLEKDVASHVKNESRLLDEITELKDDAIIKDATIKQLRESIKQTEEKGDTLVGDRDIKIAALESELESLKADYCKVEEELEVQGKLQDELNSLAEELTRVKAEKASESNFEKDVMGIVNAAHNVSELALKIKEYVKANGTR